MRLLQINSNGELSLVEYFGNSIPPYAILSHTWGADDDEISFKDVKKNRARSKPFGYRKTRFCGEQALRDDIHFFWVDTCCIKQESSQEVSEAINSMYRWYHNAVTCYVYLADVTVGTVTHEGIASVSDWSPAFRSSRWFTRGWTLQELLAPVSIEFYSKDGYRLGDRTTLLSQIQRVTGIAEAALRGNPLSNFAVEERMSWARKRITKREEDAAYALLGIFGVHMPLIYGEGQQNALKRLQREIVRASREEPLSPILSLSSMVASSDTTPHPSSTSSAVVSGPAAYGVATGASTRQFFSPVPTSLAVPDLHFVFRIDEIGIIQDIGPAGMPAGMATRLNEGITGKWWMCGSSIHQITKPPAAFELFDKSAVLCSSGTYLVAQGDAPNVNPPGEGVRDWHNLSFLHNDDFSSSLHIRGTHPTLRCQRSNSFWPRFLLPGEYHGPIDTSNRYGGLRGSLSIFLALLALSVRPNELEAVFLSLRDKGQWRFRALHTGRVNGNGVVVYVYCGTAPGSTSEDLCAYESGAYGNYFD